MPKLSPKKSKLKSKPKPAPKVQPKSKLKPKSKAKPAPKAQSKSTSKPKSKSKPKVQPKPAPKGRPKSTPKPKPAALVKPASVVEPATIVKSTAIAPAAAPRFPQVKAILDRLVAGRSLSRMQQVHSAPNFGWETVAQLKSVVIRPDGEFGQAYPLVDMDLVNQQQGAKTNLVIALSNATGVDSYGQMPFNGPYATKDDIQTIIDWLNAGLPE